MKVTLWVRSSPTLNKTVGTIQFYENPSRFECAPNNLLPKESIERIRDELSRGLLTGEIDGYMWESGEV